MEKKIKDLTLIEVNKYCCSKSCNNCPLKREYEVFCLLDYIAGFQLEKKFGDILEREVDIDE